MHRWNQARRAILIAPFALTAACASGGSGPPATRPIESVPFASALDIDLARMTRTPKGLYYRDLELGTGAVIRDRDDVKVHYTGWLSNGVVIDSNTVNDPPASIPLGRDRVIKGWDEGIPGMRVGGRRLLVIPPELGYGSSRAGAIPADAFLVFDIRVVSAK